MKDYSELKRLAEDASPGPWFCENDDLFFKDDGYTRFMMTCEPGHDVCDEEGESNSHADNLRFIAAANPAVLVGLIVDLERHQRMLISACMDIGAIGSALDADSNADGEQLLTMVVDLKAENEALRKDAERFQWTNTEGNWVSRMFGKWRAHSGEYGEKVPTHYYSTRAEAIDAAIRKEFCG